MTNNLDFGNSFDISTIKKLEYLAINLNNFIKFDNLAFLQAFDITPNDQPTSIDKEKLMLKKLISINNLKRFSINIFKISDEEILNIQGENKSVVEAKICW